MHMRVLVVDDEPAMGELIEASLTSAGLETVVETSGPRAAALLAKQKFDAVFLDVHMPPPDGYALARQMRKSGLNQRTPIIMVTGDGQNEAMSRAFEAGANFFLFKPIDRGRLLRVVRAASGPMQHERRRFQRVEVSCRVTLESNGRSLKGRTTDLSLNGMLVSADDAFPLDTRVDIRLELPAQPLTGVGKVVRVTPVKQMGILIEVISAADSLRLQEFLLPLILKTSG